MAKQDKSGLKKRKPKPGAKKRRRRTRVKSISPPETTGQRGRAPLPDHDGKKTRSKPAGPGQRLPGTDPGEEGPTSAPTEAPDRVNPRPVKRDADREQQRPNLSPTGEEASVQHHQHGDEKRTSEGDKDNGDDATKDKEASAAEEGNGDKTTRKKRRQSGDGDDPSDSSDDDSESDDEDDAMRLQGDAASWSKRPKRRRPDRDENDGLQIDEAKISQKDREDLGKLREAYDITQSDIDHLQEQSDKIDKEGINWKEAFDLFSEDPDFQEIYRTRMKRYVDAKEDSEGMLSRFAAGQKKKLLTGRGIAGKIASFVPVAKVIKLMEDRASEKSTKRVLKAISNLGDNPVASRIANPLYATRRKAQTEATVNLGLGVVGTAQSALGDIGLPASAGAAVTALSGSALQSQAASLGEKGAKLAAPGLVSKVEKEGPELLSSAEKALREKLGFSNSESKLRNYDTTGTERTKVLLEYLGMGSRLGTLEAQSDQLKGKLPKKAVVNELLRLKIRRALGATDDSEDLLDRNPYLKERGRQRTGPGPTRVLVKGIGKDEYLKPEELATYRYFKGIENSQPGDQKLDRFPLSTPGEGPGFRTIQTSKINKLALMFKAEGLFKDGINRSRKTKGYRILLDEEAAFDWKLKKIETDQARLEDELGTNKSVKRKMFESALSKGLSPKEREKKQEQLTKLRREKARLLASKDRLPSEQVKRKREQLSKLKKQAEKDHKADKVAKKRIVRFDSPEIENLKKEIAALEKQRRDTEKAYGHRDSEGNTFRKILRS
jgi:hypothetical protein